MKLRTGAERRDRWKIVSKTGKKRAEFFFACPFAGVCSLIKVIIKTPEFPVELTDYGRLLLLCVTSSSIGNVE